MHTWKNICRVLPRILPSRLLLLRQSSAISVAFMKSEHGIFRANPPKVRLNVVGSSSFGPALRFLSEKASRGQKENSVLQDLVEVREQEQTQLTVASKVAQAGKDVSYFGIILVVSVSIADHVGTYLNEYAKKPKIVQRFKLEYHEEPVQVSSAFVLIPDRVLRIKFIDRD